MATGDLTTLANIQGWLDPAGTLVWSTGQTALLSRLISACSAYMQTAMSRIIALSTYTEQRNGMNQQRMVMLEQPIQSVTSLTIDGQVIPPRPALSATTSSPQYGYVFDNSSIMLTGWYRYCWGYGNVLAVYTAGYATVPYDLEQATIDTVGDWYKYRDRIGKLDEAIEQQTIRFTNTDLPARAKAVMLAYKRVEPVY